MPHPYNRASDPIGEGKLTAQQIDKSFSAAAQGIGAEIIHWANALRLSDGRKMNTDLAAGGIWHETGGGTSAIFLDKNNPGGIGAENDNSEGTAYDKAIRFNTRSEGVRAYIAGLITYNDINPRPEVFQYDPRFNIRRNLGYVGIVQREDKALYEYEQRYAHTYPESKYEETDGTKRYGGRVAQRTNEIYERAGRGREMAVQKPPMTIRSSNNNRNKYIPGVDGARVVEAIVYHIATGSKASNLSWLTNPNSGASCNYYIAKDGEIFELVPWEIAAWTNGVRNRPDTSNALVRKWHENGWNPNQRTVTVEHEGEASDVLTQAQLKSNNHLTAWLSQTTGVPIDRAHILGHYQIDSVNRPYCPSFSEHEWALLIGGAQALLSGSAPLPPTEPTEDPNAKEFEHVDYGTHWVVNVTIGTDRVPMYDGWKAAEKNKQSWGYPIGPMTQGIDGNYRQPFENGIGEVWPHGFGNQRGPVARLGGIPQNWAYYRAFVRPILAKWGVEEEVDPSVASKG